MRFDPAAYGVEVEEILALDGSGSRLMPLARGQCSSREAWERLSCTTPERLFPKARDAKAAFSGLWLYFSCLEESHRVSQDTPSANGSFWHGIMHRQEPDSGNSAYWFRRVGSHPIFPELARAAAMLAEAVPGAGFRVRSAWDPFAFIDFCEMARRKPGSDTEKLALEIQRAEWQLLFHYCASPASTGG